MKNQLTVFNYENNQVRSVAIKGEPWFVLADLCKVLELSNSRKVAERLDPDEKAVTQSYTLGGKQKMTIVNESGMYAVILRSDKPQAKPFRKWVTSEVLPTIRKTGSYAVKPVDELKAKRVETARMNAQTRRAQLLMKIAETTRTAYKEVLHSYAANIIVGQPVLPLPEVNEHTYSAGDIAEVLGTTANKIGRLANSHGLKTDKYGKYFYDKAKTAEKQVETFRYYECAIEVFRSLLNVEVVA